MLYVLLFIVVAALYLGYLALAVPIAAIFAFVVYGLGMPTAYFVGLWRVLVIRPPWLSSPKRLPKIPAGADPAALEYFYGPALTDADHAMRVGYGNCRSLWQRGAQAVVSSFGRQEVVLTGPLGVGGAVGMAAGTAVGTVAAAGCALRPSARGRHLGRVRARSRNRAPHRRFRRPADQEHPDGLPEVL